MSSEFIEAVLEDAEDSGAYCIPTIHQLDVALGRCIAEGDLDLRITGIWKEQCTAMGTGQALAQGFNVIVPDHLTHPLVKSYVPFEDMVRYHMGHIKWDYQFDGENHLFVPK